MYCKTKFCLQVFFIDRFLILPTIFVLNITRARTHTYIYRTNEVWLITHRTTRKKSNKSSTPSAHTRFHK